MKKGNPNEVDRRLFIGEAGTLAAGWTIFPSSLFGESRKEMFGSSLNKKRNNAEILLDKKWWERKPLRIVEFNKVFGVEKKMNLLSELGANMEHLTTFNGTSPGTASL